MTSPNPSRHRMPDSAAGICLSTPDGASRIRRQVNSAINNDAAPIAINTLRHDTCVTSHASGTVAVNAPVSPMTLVSDELVAKWRSLNQFALSLSAEINVTDTPNP